MRARLWSLVGVVALVAVTAGVAWAASGNGGSTATEHRYVHMYTVGPSAVVDGDSGGVGVVAPIIIHLPAAPHAYSGTVTMSFGYVTYGDGLFRADVAVRTPTLHSIGEVLPHDGRTLGPAVHRTSTTLVFQVQRVPAGRDLRLEVGVSVTPRHDAKSGISTANILVQARFALGG